MKTFEASGLVYGNYWGGGKGAYRATEIAGKSKADILKQAKKMLDNGSLDGGMGYESLIGAVLTLKSTETIDVKGKIFTHDEYEEVFIGELDEKEQDFLMDCLAQGDM